MSNSAQTYMCTGGEYPGLLCPLVSRWSNEPLISSWADCNRVGGLPPSSPGGLTPNIPGGLPPVSPEGSPPRRPWQLPPIGPVEPLFMRPGVPSKGKEVSARAACKKKEEDEYWKVKKMIADERQIGKIEENGTLKEEMFYTRAEVRWGRNHVH